MKKRGSKVLLDRETVDAVCIAEMGQNNNVIRSQTGICSRTGAPLSDGQIQYRLTQAKKIAGFRQGDGFRKAWREGRSQFSQLARRAVMQDLRENYQTQIAAQVAKPEPKTVTQERFEKRWRGRAARYERTGKIARAA
jgi:hypothetical protein